MKVQYTMPEVAEMLGVTTVTLRKYVNRGLIPQPIRYTKRTVRYNADTVREIIGMDPADIAGDNDE